jgi:hypothetical protein
LQALESRNLNGWRLLVELGMAPTSIVFKASRN